MKVAVIGGNLLACATTLHLAIIQAHDERKTPGLDDPIQVTLFEKTDRLGGNSFKSVRIDDSLSVEVGAYRTLPLMPGSFLNDLVEAANGTLGSVNIMGRPVFPPGSNVVRRGSRDAAPTSSLWTEGMYHRVIRTFAAWDWKDDTYHLIHRGWSVLDFFYRFLNNAIWRSVALGGLLWTLNILQDAVSHMDRAVALAQVVIMFGIFLFSPRRVVGIWQQQYSFWGTTLPQLLRYGITPAVSRGSTIGFAKHLADMNQKNFATIAISVGTLINRCGLDAYVFGTGDDYVRKFNYNRNFVAHFMTPIVGWHHAGARLSDISSLASHLTMFDADHFNSDAATRFQKISPDNAALCPALIEAARATMQVDTRMSTSVREIEYDSDKSIYTLTLNDGSIETFDGIVLCATPKTGEMIIRSPRGASLDDLLGYDRNAKAEEMHAAQEEEYRVQGGQVEEEEPPVAGTACSHIAVVEGVARGSFFRFASEKQIPDLVQITHAPGLSMVERIREVSEDEGGVYTILCGSDFVQGGLLSEMFEVGATVKYFEELSTSRYNHSALPLKKSVDDCTPYIVLGNRFVYAAALECLAKHPEMDAIAAVNAASLFSRAVQWNTEEAGEGVAEGDEGEGEDQIEAEEE